MSTQPEPRAALPPPRRRIFDDSEPPPAAPKPRFWLPWLALLLLSIAAAFGFELWTLAREPRWAELHLDAQQTADELEISWDRQAPVVAHALRGILSITDGEARKNIELTTTEIRGGKFSYHSLHPDVLFRLQIYGDGLQTSGDTLRYVSVAPQSAARRSASKPAEPEAPIANAIRPPVRPLVAAIAMPPAVLDEVQPTIPESIRARIEEHIVVPVQVEVSASGKVTSSAAEGDGDGLYRYLAEQSAAAARRWRFKPAESVNGSPVAARKTVYFDFTPVAEH
jgi:hypothetical protein